MKILAFLVCFLAMFVINAKAQQNFFGRPGIESAVVNSDHTVTFRFVAADAKEVSVSGQFGVKNESNPVGGFIPPDVIPMTKDEKGVWAVTVGPLTTEIYGYTFSVDGAKVVDPLNVNLMRDGTRLSSAVIIPGEKGDLYSIQNIPHGTLSQVWYDSPTLNLKRRMYVYTPAGYEANEKYPVFYLLHGSGGDEDAWTSMGRAPMILDNLIASGKAKPMIVVMTNGNANEMAAPNAVPVGVKTDEAGVRMDPTLFPQSLVMDVIPFIEKSYRVIANKNSRAVAGLSMGGAHTIMASNLNPGVFGYIGVFSSGPREKYRIEYDDTFKTQLAALKGTVNLYYLGCGVDDGAMEGTDNLETSLKENGFNYKYSKTSGGHTWNNWRIYLNEFAPLLFK